MDLRFSDVISKMRYHAARRADGYDIPMAPHYNRVVGNIVPGIYTAIAGMPGAGTTSFMDQNYIMNVLIQWYNTDMEERPHLHIKYFSPKVSELKKLQQFICLYVKLVYGVVVDIPTLNSQPGKLYDVGKNQKLLKALDAAEAFFDEILSNDILEIISKPLAPTAMYSQVADHMDTMGDFDGDTFTIHEAYEDSLVMVAIDSVGDILKESDGFSSPNMKETYEKLDLLCDRLKSVYNINCTLTVPAEVGYIRSPKDSEPFTRQLGPFLKNCDRGTVIYNPIQEGNRRLYEDDAVFIGSRSKAILMRYWFVVRNVDGVDSAKNRLLFLPGVGFHLEYDEKTDVLDNKVTESILVDPNRSTYILPQAVQIVSEESVPEED